MGDEDIRLTPDDGERRQDGKPQESTRPRGSRFVAIALIAAIIGIAAPTVYATIQHQRAQEADERARALTEVVAAPDTELVTAPVGDHGGISAITAVDKTVVLARSFPAIEDDRAYQVWLAHDDEISSPGSLDFADGSALISLPAQEPGTVLSVTLESAMGASEPSGDAIVTLEL